MLDRIVKSGHMIVVALLSTLGLFCAAGLSGAAAQGDFYSAAGVDLAALRPGALIRSQAIWWAPNGTRAYRVLYRSSGLRDEPIAVSGVVIVPDGPAPAGGRKIVAWAHPTTGVVSRCAPSLARVLFRSIQGLDIMARRGYAVAATDYPGLGTAGPHPYLVGESEGRAVLDSVRAARQVPGVGDGRAFAVWGHSQGGQAALFTGLLARSYAPDLDLVGVSAAAPATELGTLMSDDMGTPGGDNLTAMTLWAWAKVFGAPMDKVVTPQAVPVIDRLAGMCIERFFDVFARRGPSRQLARSFLSVDDLPELQPWRSLMEESTPGPLPAGMPVFLAQGTTDNIVDPKVTSAYMEQLCRAGSPVRMQWLPGVGHAFAARDGAPAAMRWIADRFAGAPAPSDCGRP